MRRGQAVLDALVGFGRPCAAFDAGPHSRKVLLN